MTMLFEVLEEVAANNRESRNIFTLDVVDDERDPPEACDDSEPLDQLTMELTALKMGRDFSALSHRNQEENSFERIRNARDSLLAEVEVRKMQKSGLFFQSATTSIAKERSLFSTVERNELSTASGGTEDNPIPATKSLVDSPPSGTTEKALQPATATGKTLRTNSKVATAKRPPLPPRARMSPKQTAKPKATVLETIDSPYQPEYAKNGRSRQSPNDYNKPIVIDSEETLTNEYDYQEPVGFNLGNREHPARNYRESVEKKQSTYSPRLTSVNSVSIDALVARSEQSEKIISPCQNSSIVKSAYVLESSAEVSSSWPEELAVSSQTLPLSSGEHIVDLSQMDSTDLEPEYASLDLSQMDPDELEAEYDRLVKTKHEPKTCKNLAIGDMKTAVKRKPLDEIRKRSMVSDVESTDEQDAQIEAPMMKVHTPQVIHLEEEEEEEEDDDEVEEVEDAEEGEGDEEKESIENRMEPQETPQEIQLVDQDQISLVGQEPPVTLGQEDASLDEAVPSQEFEENIEDEGDEDTVATFEQDQYIFVKNDDGSPKKQSKAKIDYDFSSIERVVADYFGGKNRLAEEAADPATTRFKKNMFINGGGCCIGFP